MDLLIKGMEIPKSCFSECYGYCPFFFFDGAGGLHCSISSCRPTTTKRPKGCPLVALKPHGRLIDADAIKKRIDDGIENMTRVGIVVDAQFLWDLINVALNEAPTIVEASKEKK